MGHNSLQKAEVGASLSAKGADAVLGDQLKSYFDAVVVGPVPDRLLKLAEALDQAFDRGDLRCCDRRPAVRLR